MRLFLLPEAPEEGIAEAHDQAALNAPDLCQGPHVPKGTGAVPGF